MDAPTRIFRGEVGTINFDKIYITREFANNGEKCIVAMHLQTLVEKVQDPKVFEAMLKIRQEGFQDRLTKVRPLMDFETLKCVAMAIQLLQETEVGQIWFMGIPRSICPRLLYIKL